MADNFNMIRFPLKHSRGGKLSYAMRRFSEMVEDLELWDMPLQGGLFTWSSDLNNRFLISEDWEDHFPRVV